MLKQLLRRVTVASYIVAFDLVAKPENSGALTHAIKELGKWAMLSSNCYTVTSNLPPGRVREFLRKHLDAAACLYVMPTRRPYASLAPQEINDWLDGHLDVS